MLTAVDLSLIVIGVFIANGISSIIRWAYKEYKEYQDAREIVLDHKALVELEQEKAKEVELIEQVVEVLEEAKDEQN